jgi:hypothetical protein
LITGSWETGPVEATPTVSFTTTWYTPSNTYVVPTATVIFNETRESLLEELTKYCWITEEHYEAGFVVDDLTAGCLILYEKYCEPSLDAPAPTSARIPAVCTPTVMPEEEEEGEGESFAASASASALPTAGARVGAGLAAAKPKATNLTTISRTSVNAPVPTPSLDGMKSSCKKFFLVKHDGESCLSIIRHWKIAAEKVSETFLVQNQPYIVSLRQRKLHEYEIFADLFARFSS